MSSAPKQTLLKPSTDNEETLEAEKSPATNDLSLSELQLLHEGLAALREADGEEEGTEQEEHKSVRALIAYAACDLGINEEVVRAQVERHFEFSDISELRDGHYDELVQFLKDLNIKQFIN